MAEARVLSAKSGAVSTRDVDISSLGERSRKRLLKAAVVGYHGNQRLGTHSTKTRAEVARTERKPYRQKGTGRARAGDFSSPLWKGGGVTFGPRPRSYRTDMNRRARREALRSAVLVKFQSGEAHLLTDVAWDRPSTKQASRALQALEAVPSALVVLPGPNETLFKSFRNLPRVDVLPASDVNAMHVLKRRHLVFVENALEVLEARLRQPSSEASDAE